MSTRRLRATFLTHRIAAHLDAMGVMDQAVEDAVGGGGIPDLLMPAGYRKLRGQNRRARLVAILADLPEVAALSFGQRCHGPVIDHQHVDAAELDEKITQTPIGPRDRQIAEQRGGACAERGVAVAATKLLPTPVGPSTRMFS